VPRMNYRGSYPRLAGNSTSAMMAAVEVYDKPRFAYRDEVTVILMMNAWELLLKAVVSRAAKSIFQRKVRAQPYRTLSWGAAFNVAVDSGIWPKDVAARAVRDNLELLALYRNSSLHFYNEPEFGKLLYSLMQTSLFNYRDLLGVAYPQLVTTSASVSWCGTQPRDVAGRGRCCHGCCQPHVSDGAS
jgi:Domain of unknown function (DUF3644)